MLSLAYDLILFKFCASFVQSGTRKRKKKGRKNGVNVLRSVQEKRTYRKYGSCLLDTKWRVGDPRQEVLKVPLNDTEAIRSFFCIYISCFLLAEMCFGDHVCVDNIVV